MVLAKKKKNRKVYDEFVIAIVNSITEFNWISIYQLIWVQIGAQTAEKSRIFAVFCLSAYRRTRPNIRPNNIGRFWPNIRPNIRYRSYTTTNCVQCFKLSRSLCNHIQHLIIWSNCLAKLDLKWIRKHEFLTFQNLHEFNAFLLTTFPRN